MERLKSHFLSCGESPFGHAPGNDGPDAAVVLPHGETFARTVGKETGETLVLRDGSRVRLKGMKGHLLTVEPQDSREGSGAYQVSWNELPFNSLHALARECRQKQPAEFSSLADTYSKPLLIFGRLTGTISSAQQEKHCFRWTALSLKMEFMDEQSGGGGRAAGRRWKIKLIPEGNKVP